jgi:hypothetical protein
MSFMKMPTQVWKKLIGIQRAFLWGGVTSGRKISWVKWDVVCKKKRDGGLGVKDVRVMNLSLLSKWRWRILQNESSLWREVIADRYGDQIAVHADWTDIHFPSNSSNWWKDLKGIESAAISHNWVTGGLKRRIGNGETTNFWVTNWTGGGALCMMFPRLFSLSEQKEALISEVVGEGFNSSTLLWRRRLFGWEEELVGQLQEMLQEVRLTMDSDKWIWSLEEDGIFLVKSAYLHLASLMSNLSVMSELKTLVFRDLWSSPAPSKIIAFSWQLLYDRLPSKQNLLRRGAGNFLDKHNCGWCVDRQESDIHLLLHCCFAQSVLREICFWLGLNMVIIPPNLFILFLCFMEGAGSKKVRKGFLLIWHSTLWFLWKTRNRLFSTTSSKLLRRSSKR